MATMKTLVSLYLEANSKNWETEKFNFKKITPLATKTLNIESIYDSHISTRI